MRPCRACTHKNRVELDLALAEHKESYRTIAHRYRLSEDCVKRHRKNHLPVELAKVEKRAIRDREGLLRRIEWNMGFVEKMRRSCDHYLQDPHNAHLYDLGPRAHDIEVTYIEEGEEDGPPPHVQRAKLSELLEEIHRKKMVTGWKWTIADPRDLILKSAKTLNETLLLLGRAMELLKAEGESQTNIQVNLVELMPVVYHILERHPLALKDVQEAVRASYES